MELYTLMSGHRSALGEFAQAQSDEARQWAEARIDYYASRICALRQETGEARFDFRKLTPAN